MAVSLLLHSVLENHGDAENEDEVDADDAESGSEDLVQVHIGVARETADATTLLRCNKGVQTSTVLHERRCGGVDVAAAVELDFVSI